MNSIHEALDRACAEAGITVPRSTVEGRWLYCDTFSGANGRNDGRVMIDGDRVTARNMQTGVDVTVRAGITDPAVLKRIAERRQKDDRERLERARRAAWQASQLVLKARAGTHPYLAAKGFAQERALVAPAALVADLGIPVVEGGQKALVIPARIGDRVTSAQIIWEDGTKKFLFGGEMGSASYRLASGTAMWLCEGYATALSLRAALRAMNRRDGILVCFTAYKLPAVARKVSGKVFIAADNDGHKPQERFGGIGTGEHCAREAGRPYAMPPTAGMDFNDMHQAEGLFAVQRVLLATIRSAMACA